MKYPLYDYKMDSIVYLTGQKPNDSFRPAASEDAEPVLCLYQSAQKGEFCVWNDNYPSIHEIAHDLETKNLYVMTAHSKIIGAISVVPENELDGFDCWSCKDGKEIARVVIDKAYQGQGLSFEMVQSIASILRKNGCRAIHLSVVKSNIPAYKTYLKAGFSVVGEAQMYGNDYYLMEKVISHEMKLHPSPFDMIKAGEKTIELRLYDEKRQLLQPGDEIVFTNTKTGEPLRTTVVKLHRFASFAELYRNLPLLQCGYTAADIATASPRDMEQYYSTEKQCQYGVVGIELTLT